MLIPFALLSVELLPVVLQRCFQLVQYSLFDGLVVQSLLTCEGVVSNLSPVCQEWTQLCGSPGCRKPLK